jgi:hypothetical protein
MLVEAKQNNKITVSFSASVGTKGMQRIKRYIEFLETNATLQKTVPQKEINLLANGITKSAWLKMPKKKQS